MAGLFDEELARIREYIVLHGEELYPGLFKNGQADFVLDGERMAKDYIDTINAKKSGVDGEAGKKNMRYRAFFLMPLNGWINKDCSITMEQNRAALGKILEACKCEKITLSKAREVQDFADMTTFVDEVTTPGYDGMPKGQEGLILKQKTALYRWDRSLDWCKVKRFYDADCRCVSWEYGRKKNAKRMGRVNVVGYLEDGTRVECGVGSGWTDEQRQDVMDNWDTYWQYQTIVVKYQEVSQGKNKEFASLRFPTFTQRVRDDKSVEA
jgi:ATP-dependent DNA ligase